MIKISLIIKSTEVKLIVSNDGYNISYALCVGDREIISADDLDSLLMQAKLYNSDNDFSYDSDIWIHKEEMGS